MISAGTDAAQLPVLEPPPLYPPHPPPTPGKMYKSYPGLCLSSVLIINFLRLKSRENYCLRALRRECLNRNKLLESLFKSTLSREKKGWTQGVGLANVSPKGLYHGIRGWFKLNSGS